MPGQFDGDEQAYGRDMTRPDDPVSAAPVIEVLESEDRVLDYTQRKRQQIVTQMMGSDGEKLEALERGDKVVLLAALDGMDRSALGRKRLKTDEKIGGSQAAAAALIARVLTAPGVAKAGMSATHVRTMVPVLPADLPEPVLVPGETAFEASPMDFDTFIAPSCDGGPGHQDG